MAFADEFVVGMGDSLRRSLRILVIGTALAILPAVAVTAAEDSPFRRLQLRTQQRTQAPAQQANPGSDQSALTEDQTPEETALTNLPDEGSNLAQTLEPGEEPVPLQSTPPPTSAMPGVLSPTGIPQSERPTDQGFETPPDYLSPAPNPLLLPTQPAQVEILGTQPISLATAIDLAFRNSEDLQIAFLQLERSREGLRAEQALLYPTADLGVGLRATNETVLGLGPDDTNIQLDGGVRADYDLGISGERSARIRAAEEQVRLSELEVERIREELRLSTINEYYAVQQAIEQIRINQTFLDEAERNLRDTQLREEVGVGTRFDVLRADVQVANARQSLTQSISDREIAQRQLARRLNVPPNINLTTLAVEIAGTWPLSLEESIVLAFQNRAELEQFLVERDFNEAQRQVSLSATRPNLGLFARFNGLSLLTSPNLPNSADTGFSVGAELNWRLFDGGAARARAAQNELDIQTDEFEFENVRNRIRLEVEEAYYTLQANQANISTATLAVQQSAEALDLANLRFQAGVGTQLDVLVATRELTEAQGNLVRAVLDYNRALARLERAVSNLATAQR
ncbi:MAG TPA: TolC family protein [Leptolyngbyaceae cyanobacterium M65_K2018_010]|nr:TolC family protein [Leptolyngbyaceae cyanobacterium M65_K2018_010]